MNLGLSFIADPKPPILVQPRQRSFHDPTVEAQAAAMFGPALAQNRFDPTSSQGLAVGLGVVAPISLHSVGLAPRSAPLSSHRRNGLYQRKELCHIVGVGGGQEGGEGDALRVGDEMMLTARFAPIRGVWAGFAPPKRARTDALSTTARDQSIWSASWSLARSSSWIFCQTPARSQSRRHRQQVIPEPHPISWGSISQGIPVLSTKTMPVKTLRVSKGLRPGYRNRLGLGGGKSGSIRFHSSSSTRGLAMCTPPHLEVSTWSKDNVLTDVQSFC